MIKFFTFLSTIALAVFLIGTGTAQPIFTEDFESGTPSPDWGLYRAGEENVIAVSNTGLPDPLGNGGNFVGLAQDIDNSYTGAAIILAGPTSLADYSIEGDVYCYVNHPGGSAYTGLVVYGDSSLGTYIKLAADFDGDQRFRLYNNHLDPTTFQYTFHHAFEASDVPGGIPTTDGWHHMKVEVKTLNADTTAFWCYFDGQQLLGCPIYDTGDDRMSSGQFGLFSFSQGTGTGLEGYFDNIVVNSLVSSADDNSVTGLPDGFNLEQNFPNPFNPETQISYNISSPSFISLTVHDLLGREIKTLVSEEKPSGNYMVSWNGKDNNGNIVPSGVYLYSLKTGSFVESKKMILMK